MLKKLRFTKKKTFVLALILAVSGTIAAIGSTLASTPISWTAVSPEGAPTNDNYMADLAGIKDSKDGRITLTASRASSWGSSHTNIARVEALDGDSATYVGLKPGTFVAYRTTSIGGLGRNEAMFYDSSMPYEYTISKNHSVIKAEGKTDTIPIRMKDMNGEVMNEAVTWISDNTSVATVDTETSIITAQTASGIANIIGKFTDCYGQPQSIHYSVIVGKISIDLVVGPDYNGDYWLPVGEPENVWQKVEEDGTPVQPPEYIYDTDGDPTDGNGVPAVKGEDGNFYVENPRNIFTPIDPDGSLNKDETIWGGYDRKPGTDDDEKAVELVTGGTLEYWVSFGENIYAQVSRNSGLIGALKGGGSDNDPITDPVTPIYDNRDKDGHFYYGPHTDKENFSYFIGDDWMGEKGDGLLNSDSVGSVHGTDSIYYLQEDGTMGKLKPDTSIDATGILLGNVASDKIVKGDIQSAPSYMVLPDEATNKTVIWSSSDPNIVRVDPNTGEITGVSEGTAIITATVKNKVGEISATYQITVEKDGTSWNDVTGYQGETFWASGYEWIILTTDNDGNAFVISKSLILHKEVQFNPSDSYGNSYKKSTLRNVCDGFYEGVLRANDISLSIKGDTSMKRITEVAQPSDFLDKSGKYNGPDGFSKVDPNGVTSCFPVSYQEAIAYLVGRPYAAASPERDYCHMRSIGNPSIAGISSTYMDPNGSFDQIRNVQNRVYNYSNVRAAMWIKIK